MRTKASTSRHQGANAFQRPAAPRMAVSGTKSIDAGLTALCPVCGAQVRTRQDETLYNHRVGTDRRASWPCNGAGMQANPW
jgi:hypothetical protein